MRSALALSVLLTAAVSPVAAQDHHAGHGAAPVAATAELPEICKGEAAAPAHKAPMGEGLDAGHQALMKSMSAMDAMASAMTAPDLDIAFVCGMIPHHQGAIAMAKAELEHGDDPWARELAQKVIAAQEQEIAEMLQWLDAQAK